MNQLTCNRRFVVRRVISSVRLQKNRGRFLFFRPSKIVPKRGRLSLAASVGAEDVDGEKVVN